MDSRDRGETLDQFLDHAALVSDADALRRPRADHADDPARRQGPGVSAGIPSGLEEGLFPHSRTMLQPDDIEEERRLCYVGMTRAMDTLILTRAVYRRRYGTDMPEASVPSRFLEEVPHAADRRAGPPQTATTRADVPRQSYEHDQGSDRTTPTKMKTRARLGSSRGDKATNGRVHREQPTTRSTTSPSFSPRAARSLPFRRLPVEEPKGGSGFRPGQKVRHPKYGEGTVYQREGEGEEAKITVQFPRFGLKKLVEKYAQLERG